MPSVTDVIHLRLDDILEMPEPDRGEILEEWVLHDEPVKIRSASGKPMEVRMNGETIVFPPAGRRVGRRTAVYLLQFYGKHSPFLGRCQATGYDELGWMMLNEEERKRLEKFYKPMTDYLTHIPDTKEEPAS
jgi:hypothetical protein